MQRQTGKARAGTDERPQAEAGSASEDRWMYAGARVLLGPRARMRPIDGPTDHSISLWLSPSPRPRGLRGLALAALATHGNGVAVACGDPPPPKPPWAKGGGASSKKVAALLHPPALPVRSLCFAFPFRFVSPPFGFQASSMPQGLGTSRPRPESSGARHRMAMARATAPVGGIGRPCSRSTR